MDEDALLRLFDAARLSDYMLDRICAQVLDTQLADLTGSTDRIEKYKAVIQYAITYGQERKLAAGLLAWGAEKPALQNLVSDGSMSPDPNTHANSSLDLVRLEIQVGRLADKVDSMVPSVQELRGAVSELRSSITELRTIIASIQADGAENSRRATISSRTLTLILFCVAAVVLAQVVMLSFTGGGR